MVERRRQGLCCNCNEKYSCGHNRFCRRIFFMDGVEIKDADDATQGADGDAPCRPSPGCPWLTPCRSQSRSVPPRWSPSSTPAAPITSSPKQRHGAHDCLFTSGHASPPWSPTASGSPASWSSVTPPSPSRAPRSRPISSSCRWPGTASSSARGGWARSGLLCGTWAAVA
jgi:hypothetical protein